MLRELRVGNLALAEDVVIPLHAGLTMLTGETGAGKSLIAGALSLLAGAKPDRRLIRQGEDLAYVEGVFDLGDRPPALALCAELGVRLGEDGMLVLRREVQREGRSRVVINGLVSSQSVLEQLAGRLLAVQSQDQTRLLSRTDFARDFLDAALGLGRDVTAVGESARAYREAAAEYARRLDEAALAREQLSMWRYQLRELEEADPDPEEEARIREVLAVGRNARALMESAGRSREYLSEGETTARGMLGAAEACLAPHEGTGVRMGRILEMIRDATAAVDEAAADLTGFLDGLELDPRELDGMEARLARIQELSRKHGRDVTGLCRLREDLARRVSRQADADEELADLAARCEAAKDDLEDRAARLRRARSGGASEVADRATRLIRPLALPDLELRFVVEPDLAPESPLALDGQACRIGTHGADRVRLLARTNKGEPAGEVGRIASGGEKSRIFLGLSVLADDDLLRPLLLFDEIDAGLGMDNARPVGDLLVRLAGDRQVLCITHLATVAVKGARHLKVSKAQRKGRTALGVRLVEGQERIDEIVRLLGGPGKEKGAGQLAYARQLLGHG